MSPSSTEMAPHNRRGGEGVVAIAFAVSILGALLLAGVYIAGGQPQLEGIGLALSLGGIGVGLVSWAKRFMDTGEYTEERPALGSSDEEIAAFTADFAEGGETLQRRGLLVKMGLGAVAALSLAVLFPLRSLGPRPGRGLSQTPFVRASAGRTIRLVDEEGRPLRPGDFELGSLATAYPAGQVQSPDGVAIVMRVPPEDLRLDERHRAWVVDGCIAYSKLCTHLGCPVGLYQADEQLLLCPCHQSTFDVLEGARPVFGPATRPLPQLPLALDDAGFLVATGDFEEPVGGGYWDRGRDT